MPNPDDIGKCNPLDEQPEIDDPEEFIMGEYRTVQGLIDKLNTNSRVVFSIDEHDDNDLYIKVNFEQ